MNMRKTLPVAILFALSGCAVGPDYQAPSMVLDETYLYAQSSAQQSENSHWWQSFGDPVLNQLVSDAQQQNISLKMASERIQMAQNYHKIVESYKLPTVSLGAGTIITKLAKTLPWREIWYRRFRYPPIYSQC